MKRQLNSAETTAHATMSSTVRTPTPGGSSVDEVARWLGRFMRMVFVTGRRNRAGDGRRNGASRSRS